MEIKFVCPYWGQEGILPSDFFTRILQEGYDGVEINMPESSDFTKEFRTELEYARKMDKSFVFIAQQVLSLRQESVEEYAARLK
jgi:hypothetical protein